MMHPLTLPQALLLLTLRDESGRPKAGFYKPAIAGAGVSELLLRGLFSVSDTKKSVLSAEVSSSSQGPFLDLIHNQVAESKKTRSLKNWVTKLGAHKELIPTLADELCDLGALNKKQSKVLGLFPSTTWPEVSPELETNLKQQMKEAICGEGDVNERLSIIIALADMADVLRHNFERDILKSNKARIKSIKDGDLLAVGATQAAVKAAQAALTAIIVCAAIVPSVAG